LGKIISPDIRGLLSVDTNRNNYFAALVSVVVFVSVFLVDLVAVPFLLAAVLVAVLEEVFVVPVVLAASCAKLTEATNMRATIDVMIFFILCDFLQT